MGYHVELLMRIPCGLDESVAIVTQEVDSLVGTYPAFQLQYL